MTEADELELLRLRKRKALAAQSAPSAEAPASETEAAAPPGNGPGLPDLGPLNAIRAQFASGLSKGGFDEGIAELFSRSGRAMPGAHLRMPDGTMVPVSTREDMYRGSRDFLRQEQAAAQQHWPKLGFAANMGGEALSDYALAGAGAASRGFQTVTGLARGLLSSNAELTPDKTTLGDMASAGFSTGLGGLIGNQVPLAFNRAGDTRAAQYLGTKMEGAAGFVGDKLKNLAGWLKVNSLHPTPLKAEAMASLPGGVAAVGREVLDRGIGGLTKAGTARQAKAATAQAGGVVSRIARDYDNAGGAPLDIGAAIDAAKVKAKELFDEPTTKAAGERLAKLIEEYEAGLGPSLTATAANALQMKRALAKAAYGAGNQLKKTGDTIAGNFGEGLAVFERSVNDVLEGSLGAPFQAANLTFRRLLGASDAARRTAARQDTNLLALGLQNMGGGTLGAVLGGGPGAAAGLLGTMLARKYGAQAGASTLHGLGRFLGYSPQLARPMAQSLAAPAAARAATRPMFEFPSLAPALAGGDESPGQRLTDLLPWLNPQASLMRPGPAESR